MGWSSRGILRLFSSVCSMLFSVDFYGVSMFDRNALRAAGWTLETGDSGDHG